MKGCLRFALFAGSLIANSVHAQELVPVADMFEYAESSEPGLASVVNSYSADQLVEIVKLIMIDDVYSLARTSLPGKPSGSDLGMMVTTRSNPSMKRYGFNAEKHRKVWFYRDIGGKRMALWRWAPEHLPQEAKANPSNEVLPKDYNVRYPEGDEVVTVRRIFRVLAYRGEHGDRQAAEALASLESLALFKYFTPDKGDKNEKAEFETSLKSALSRAWAVIGDDRSRYVEDKIMELGSLKRSRTSDEREIHEAVVKFREVRDELLRMRGGFLYLGNAFTPEWLDDLTVVQELPRDPKLKKYSSQLANLRKHFGDSLRIYQTYSFALRDPLAIQTLEASTQKKQFLEAMKVNPPQIEMENLLGRVSWLESYDLRKAVAVRIPHEINPEGKCVLHLQQLAKGN
jgi:hypothetical protein